jgi:drug/metabolite transporter (DMT)-like permease
MVVFGLSPLLILAMACAFGGERAHPAAWIAAAVGYCGVLLLHPPTRPGSLALLVFPLGMALSFSLYVVMTRSLRHETMRANLFYTALGVLLVLTPVMPAEWAMPSAGDALVLAGVGVLGFFTLYALDRAVHAAPVSVVAPLIYLQLPAFLGLLFVAGSGGNWSLRRAALASLLIAVAAVYLWARESRQRTTDDEAHSALRNVPKEQ